MYHCKARHVAAELVIETFREELAWDGLVDSFELEGHPKAKRCYAWEHFEDGELRQTTVLEIPPVDSAESAVEVAIKKSKN